MKATSVGDLPRLEAFQTPVDVVESDIDQLGHVSNIIYLKWVQDVALAHSVAVGLDFEAYRALGGVFVVRRQEIDYLRPVLRGDRLELRTWIDTVMAAKCRRATEIACVSRGENVVVATAMTTWGWIDFKTGRPARIPAAVRAAFGVGVGIESRGPVDA